MVLALSVHALPLLLGYLLFVAVSGRFGPVHRPVHLEDRPAWALGLWIGISSALVLSACVHLAHRGGYENPGALFKPGLGLLGLLLIPGLIAAYAYRGNIRNLLNQNAMTAEGSLLSSVESLPFADSDNVIRSDRFTEEFDARDDHQMTRSVANDTPLIAAFLDTATPGLVSTPDIPVARPDSAGETDLPADQQLSLDTVDSDLLAELTTERRRREETETHLRITRRALHRLEAAQQEREADELSREELPDLTSSAACETSANEALLELQADLVAARRMARRANAARTKALAAARRAANLAHESISSREVVEAALLDTEIALENRQETISSLIAALDKEKSRTHENIAQLARQWVLKDRRQRAQGSLNGVAQSVEGRPTTRLARKVARGRPMVSNG